MAQRKSVTLIYKYHDNWIGGTYYIINIIRNMLYLPDQERPVITICYEGPADSLDSIKKIGYPYISFVKFNDWKNFLIRAINLITYKVFKQKWLLKKIPIKKVTNLYPGSTAWSLTNIDNLYLWIPDFQERYLPQFFTDDQLKSREEGHLKIMNSKLPIVFSSYTALNDYNTFYPQNANPKQVLQFATNIGDSYKNLSVSELNNKFHIDNPYFIVSNQFWKHKNHMVVIKAVRLLKEASPKFQVVFTGKEHDFRNPDYITDIKDYISVNKLDEYINFLGFIERDEQLQLMKNALAIIQPSLFEGWSTVVEDAKALNQYIILSDIPLHKEQINKNCSFFNPYNEADLADKMAELISKPINIETVNYHQLIEAFAYNFIALLK